MIETYVTSELVLVVDDVEINRLLLRGLLEARGHRVVEAANGLEALEAIARERPALVLLDLMMPVLDGFGVLERLREDKGPFMPVIVVSSANDLDDRCRALKAGAFDLLSKPIVREELELRVRNVLALRANHNRVEELVARRTEELRQANERLLAADRHKDEFLTVIGHELRTPLTAIVGFVYLLGRTLGEGAGDERLYVEGIQIGADRLKHLVEMLMDFATAKAGRLALQRSHVVLRDAAAAALEPLRPLAEQKAIQVELALEAEAAVQADRVRLDQIFKALLDNAVKFTPHGGRIRVEAIRGEEMVTLAVVDTGVGFDEADRPALFTPFKQADMSYNRPAEGAGLGLAFARALVEAHGGSIEAESAGKGRGATLRFSLPVG